MQHDADYEAEECENMLDDEELVPEVANWRQRGQVEPEEERICFDS